MIQLVSLYNWETLILLAIASIGAIFANLIRYMVARSRPDETRPDFDRFYWAWFFLIFPDDQHFSDSLLFAGRNPNHSISGAAYRRHRSADHQRPGRNNAISL